MRMLGFLLARFSEPSSYAGLGAILALVGLQLSDSDLGLLAQFLAAGCALVALLLKERGTLQVLALCALVTSMLGACAPSTSTGASTETRGGALAAADQLAGSVDGTIATACAQYEKRRSAATAILASRVVPIPVVKNIAIIEQYADAACANPPAGDVFATAIWVSQLAREIAALTTVQPGT